VRFLKGHGTENDFVVLPDAPPLEPELVRALCDRRAGIGADGVLRVERRDGGFFMDYRNADGSVAEMCGNGIRVYARYLVDAGLAEPGTLAIGTRAGERVVQVPPAGDVTVEMGPPTALGAAPIVDGRPAPRSSMGNPHVVVELPDLATLGALDLSRPPDVRPPLPDGQNVEWVVRRGPRCWRCGCTSGARGRPAPAAPGVCAAVVAAVARGDGAGWTSRGPWTCPAAGSA
jgi:diaminopimelate epimerase